MAKTFPMIQDESKILFPEIVLSRHPAIQRDQNTDSAADNSEFPAVQTPQSGAADAVIRELAASVQTYVLIGPPGTGKTTELSRMVQEAHDLGWMPLIASLTKAAAREIASRDLGIEEHRVGTLHAHAYRALGAPTIAEGELKAWNVWVDARGLSSNWHIAENYGKKRKIDDPHDQAGGDDEGRTDAQDWLERVGILRARMLPPAYWIDQRLRRFHELWCEWKTESGLLDFTDLIERCYRDDVPPKLQFDALYFDEAQDMSRLEMALALSWAKHARAMVVVGDPHQNLYAWRGSDASVLITLYEAAKRKRTLKQSYRVPRAVHGAALAWIEQLPGGFDYDYEARDVAGAVRRSGLDLSDPEALERRIEEDIQRDGRVMVLTSCTYMLNGLVAILRERGIPFFNPYRTHNGRWNPLLHAHKPTSTVGRLVAFTRVNERVWGDESRFWSADELAGWADLVDAKVFAKKGSVTGVKGQDWPIDPKWFAEQVREVEDLEAMFGGDLHWLSEHVIASKRQTLIYPMRVAHERGVQALIEMPRLIVGTIHSVKGGEAERVYLFPDLSPSGYDEYGSDAAPTLRQFYVGMTRAKEELILCSPSSMRAVDWQ